MTHRLRICGLMLAATLIASPLPAANTYVQASFFDTSGPVAISVNHSANLCVTNLGNRTTRTLLAYINAQTTPNPNNLTPPQILAVREAALDPGAGFCLGKTGAELKAAVGANAQWDSNVIGIMVPEGHFTGQTDANGIIIQGGIVVQGGSISHPGGCNDNGIVVEGGLVPSLQLFSGGTLVLTPNMNPRSAIPGPHVDR
jgi:hypothetical protein